MEDLGYGFVLDEEGIRLAALLTVPDNGLSMVELL
jgi:hypothetical protein